MTIRLRLLIAFGAVLVVMLTMAIVLSGGFGLAAALIVCAVSMLFTAMVGLFTVRVVTHPITSLIREAYAVGHDRLDRRIEYDGKADLAVLAAEFNRLLDELQGDDEEAARLNEQLLEYKRELDGVRSHMEERITKRTRDLHIQSERAAQDELTGLLNRREAITKLELFWDSEKLYGDRLACIIIDIDHFKSFNDTYGHVVGDRILKETAALLRSNVRSTDTVCRVGGEEFLVICPRGSAQGAAACAEHLRAAVEDHTVSLDGQSLHVAISLGVAEREEHMANYEDLLRKADKCLYAAKREGRNRVVVADDVQVATLTKQGSIVRALDDAHTAGEERSGDDSIRVLLIAHDPRAREDCHTILEEESFEVVEATGESDVPAIVKETVPDVIMLCAVSSRSESSECTRRLKADPVCHDMPIIVVGEHGLDEDAVAALEAGADEYAARPLHRREMVLRLKSLARQYRSKRELMHSNRLQEQQQSVTSLLFGFSRSLASANTLSAVLEKTLSVTARLTGCRRISIMLPDEQRKHLVVAKALGIDEEAYSEIQVPDGSGTVGRVFRSRNAVLINTTEQAEPLEHTVDSWIFGDAPLLSSPLSVASLCIGVLNVSERDDHGPFEGRELEYIDQICNMAATAIADSMNRKSRDQARDSIVEALGKLAEYRDHNTGHHLERVTQFSLLLAEELSTEEAYRHLIGEQFLRDLTRAVPLHDVGKVGIPDQILLKPHKLTHEETAIMQSHVNVGVETIRSVRTRVSGAEYLKMAEEIAGGHHEWYNGAGYPKKCTGEDIPLSARIVALADVYDALATKRPYKPAFSHAEAVQIITKLSGLQFDPSVVDAFRKREQQFAVLALELSDHSASSDDDASVPGPVSTVQPEDDHEETECYSLTPL